MPTLEERLQALEHALSIMQSEHISDIRQLSERVDIVQRQIAEQHRRVSEQGQSLEKILSQQFSAINQGFLQQEHRFQQLEQQGRQQTDEIKAKFEAGDHFAARTWGLAQEQERDIRTMKEDVQSVSVRFDSVDKRLDGIDQRFDDVDRRFDTQDEKLNLILERLPKQ